MTDKPIFIGVDPAKPGSDRTDFMIFAGGKVVILPSPPPLMKDITDVATVRQK